MAVLDLIRTTAPAALLGIESAKAHLRVDGDDENDVIQGMLDGAVDLLDGYAGHLGRAVVQQSWRLHLSAFPCGRVIKLPLPPLISVEAVLFTDPAGVERTLAPEAYEVVAGPTGMIVLRTGFAWPSVACMARAIKINFTAGYGAPGDVPKAIVQAVKVTLTAWYADREGERSALPIAAQRLLAAYRVPKI